MWKLMSSWYYYGFDRENTIIYILGNSKNSQITINEYKGKFTFVLKIYVEILFISLCLLK